jgi:hypothetical protein
MKHLPLVLAALASVLHLAVFEDWSSLWFPQLGGFVVGLVVCYFVIVYSGLLLFSFVLNKRSPFLSSVCTR